MTTQSPSSPVTLATLAVLGICIHMQQLTVAKDLNITLIIDDPQSQNKTRFFKKQLEKATRLRVL